MKSTWFDHFLTGFFISIAIFSVVEAGRIILELNGLM